MSNDLTPPSDDELDDVLDVMKAALSTLPETRLAAIDSVPASVLEGARWIHDWANMDAELAQLTQDSVVDGRLAGVRSASPLRQITFECDSFEVQIEVERAERGALMTGTVSPATTGTVRAVVGGISYEGIIDDLGTFTLDNVNHGVVMAYVTTEHTTVRLGSFEV